MKFLAITQNKDIYYMLPPETRVKVMDGGFAFVDKYRKTGKCKDIYFTADLKGGVSIWEVESGEEAARLMLENPQLPFIDIDIQPIVEWDAGMKVLAEYREKLAEK